MSRNFLFLVSLIGCLSACGGGGDDPGPGSNPSTGRNTAPVAEAGANQSVIENTSVTLDGSASSDADGDTLTYAWIQTAGPEVDVSDATKAKSSFITPEVTGNTTLTFTLTVNDSKATATDTIDVTVTNLNHAPVADAGDHATVTEGDTVTLDSSGSSDEDGDTLTYIWTQTAGPNVTLADADTATPSFTAPDVADTSSLTFVVTVDDGNEEASETVDITIEPILLDVAISETKTLTFTWNGIADADHYRLLENPDGASGFEVLINGIDAANEAVNLTVPVHLFDWMNAEYLLEACLDEDCTDAVLSDTRTTDELLPVQAAGYVKASNTGEDDEFGSVIAVSADGNTMAVGSFLEESADTNVNGDESDNSAATAGAVYVFARDRETGQWVQQAYVKASNTFANDQFGSAIALSGDGNLLAVGAPHEDSDAIGIDGDAFYDNRADSGAVYLYTRANNGTWAPAHYLKASNAGIGDLFGSSVALSDDGATLAVGARRERSNATHVGGDETNDGQVEAGAAYVFALTGGNWMQQAYIKATNTGAQDHFGAVIALSGDGNTLAVGAPDEDSFTFGPGSSGIGDGASAAGAVYVYTRSGGTWATEEFIKPLNTGADDNFGSSIALSFNGDALLVGAPLEDGSSTGFNGTNSNGTAASGAAYLFSRAGTAWQQDPYIKASNTGSIDRFGSAVALSADGLGMAIGAPGERASAGFLSGDQNDNARPDNGAVYVFRHMTGTWAQVAYAKPISRITNNERFGGALAMSADGVTLAIAGNGDDSNATGVNGDQTNNDATDSGAVYIY